MESDYPFCLFEIEEQEDESALVSCCYAKFEDAIKNATQQISAPMPILFIGITESWAGDLEIKNASVLSKTILEAVRENLLQTLYSKAVIQLESAFKLLSWDQRRASVWLWGPPIQVVVGTEGEKGLACLLCYVSDHSKVKNTYISEFVTKCVLLSLCSLLGDVTYAQNETDLIQCAKYMTEQGFLKQVKNLNFTTIYHLLDVKSSQSPPDIEIASIRRIPIRLFDDSRTQLNTILLSNALSSLKEASKVEVVKCGMLGEVLSTTNVTEALRSIVSSANQHLVPGQLPKYLKSFYEPMDDDPPEEDLQLPSQSQALTKSRVPAHVIAQEHQKEYEPIHSESVEMQSNHPDYLDALKDYLSHAVDKLDEINAVSETQVQKCLKNCKSLFRARPSNILALLEEHANTFIDCISEYIRSMNEQFKKVGYFQDDILASLHTDATAKISHKTQKSPETIKIFAKLACSKLYTYISSDNKFIRQHHQSTVSQSKNKVNLMYSAVLERIRLEKGPFPPKLFQKLTATLFAKCMDAFKTATEYKGQSLKNCTTLASELDALAASLKSEASAQAAENQNAFDQQESKLKTEQSKDETPKTNKEIDIAQPNNSSNIDKKPAHSTHEINLNYSPEETKADDVLPKENYIIQKCINEQLKAYKDDFGAYIKSKRFEIDKLRQEHTKLVQRIKKMFEIEIRSKLDKPHKSINKIWQKEMHAEIEKSYRIEKEKLIPPNLVKNQKSGDHKQKHKKHSDKHASSHDDETVPPINIPLVFHITTNTIAAAVFWNGKPIVVNNQWNESATPLIVAQSENGKMIYGEKQLQLLKSRQTIKIQEYNIGRLLEDGKIALEKVLVENEKKEARMELLLAFLIKKLKLEAEKTVFHGDISDCCICIPFHYTSMQRSRIVESARIAGFNKVQLLNDISAVAYNFVTSVRKGPPDGTFLVLTESSDKILDAGVYTFNRLEEALGTKKYQITMVAHSGTYHVDDSKLKGLIKNILETCELIKSILQNKEMEFKHQKEMEKAYSIIRLAVKNYHDKVLHHTGCTNTKSCVDDVLSEILKNTVLVSSDSHCEDLKTVITTISGRCPDNTKPEAMLLGATCIFSKNDKCLIKISDMLASSLYGVQNSNIVLEKGVALTNSPTKFCISTSSESVEYYQKLFKNTTYRTLKVRFSLKEAQKVNIHMSIKSDGIFYLTKIVLLKTEHKVKTSRDLKEGQEYTISDCSLSKSDKKDYRRWVTSFFKE